MAEKQSEDGRDGFDDVPGDQSEVKSVKHAAKRCSSTNPSAAPPPKSPHSDVASPSAFTSEAGDGAEVEEVEEVAAAPRGSSSSSRRKSWWRATLTRRSLPSLPFQHHTLCKNISTSLSQQERLDRLIEASMKFALERSKNSLQSVPNVSLESFDKQVERMQKQWARQAGDMKTGLPATEACRDTPVKAATEKVRNAITTFQIESERWEALLNKHRSKAKELERKVEQGLEEGVSLSSASVAQSSQYHVIQSKPDYLRLCTQQPLLQALEIFMDTQAKMIMQFQCFREQTQLLVKETSSRLAAEAGFQDISPDVLKKLMAVPIKCSAASPAQANDIPL